MWNIKAHKFGSHNRRHKPVESVQVKTDFLLPQIVIEKYSRDHRFYPIDIFET